MKSKTIKTYSELVRLPTFEERFRYLQMNGKVADETFGFDRIFNQQFYRSKEWKRLRNEIIVRDKGCDLACEGREIYGKVIIHHLNPIAIDDISSGEGWILDPEYLITTTLNTHNAIHYGDESLLVTAPIERSKFDTCPWRKTDGQHTQFG